MSSCELDASGSPGTAPYWKFLDLVVYSVGPFLVTFFVNTAIIVSIYRERRLQSQFVSTLRVRFLTNPVCLYEKSASRIRAKEENAATSQVEREVALVERPAGTSSRSRKDELRKPL